MLIQFQVGKTQLQKRRSLTGFTLIEIVIVIVVLSLVAATLLTVMGAISQNVILPFMTQIATGLAEKQFERVIGLRFSQVTDEGPAAFAFPFTDYSYEITVSPVPANLFNDPSMTRYKQVEIEVSHALVGHVNVYTVVTNH